MGFLTALLKLNLQLFPLLLVDFELFIQVPVLLFQRFYLLFVFLNDELFFLIEVLQLGQFFGEDGLLGLLVVNFASLEWEYFWELFRAFIG